MASSEYYPSSLAVWSPRRMRFKFIIAVVSALTAIHILYTAYSGQYQVQFNAASISRFTRRQVTSRHAGHRLATHPEAIQRDMERCSLALGVGPDSLAKVNNTLRAISEKASQFLRHLWSVVPRSFSTDYKNPCWHANATIVEDLKETLVLQRSHVSLVTTRLYPQSLFNGVETGKEAVLCLPYFFLADFPKCGTTTLHSVLAKHESIESPALKEVQWWTRGPLGQKDETVPQFYEKGVLVYLLNLFKGSQKIRVSTEHVTFDASPGLLSDGSTFGLHHQDYCALPAVLSQVLPNAKFIVIMRNPADRVYSHYLQKCTSRKGPGLNITTWPEAVRENPAAHFHKELLSDLRALKDCLKHRSLLECVRFAHPPPDRQPCGIVGNKLTGSLYYIHLQKWLQFYPKEQFLYLRLEELSSDPHRIMEKLTKFLGIKDVPSKTAMDWFASHRNLNTIVGTGKGNELVMRETSRQLLAEFYRPYNHMLATLLGDTGFLWDSQ